MITLPLQLRYADRPQRAAAACFVPGAAAADWLAELTRWQIPLAPLRLYVVPTSSGDLAPRGVLVVGPAQRPERAAAAVQPYGCVAGRLYVPLEARFWPDVNEAEIETWLPSREQAYVWHPAAGLVAFEPQDVLGVADLLASPPRVAADWGHAQPGVAWNERLLSLEPDRAPAAQSLLFAGRDDIGQDANDLRAFPPADDEPRGGGLGAAGQALSAWMARMIKKLAAGQPRPASGQTASAAGKDPSAAAGGGWFQRLTHWAEQRLRQAAIDLAGPRARALERLMHLLDRDPDEGLRYALPLHNEGEAARGLSPPGTSLPRHSTDFNLRRLSGGGPVDPWVLQNELRQRLLQRYRQLAERELKLERYRRAAYIYAELLGDVRAAVGALTAGRFWREAAALWRERLKSPREAAQCLERGGLWSEAIAAYEELGEHEKVGELYTQLERPDEAARAFRQAAAQFRQAGDLVRAAGILETRLDAPDEALELLAAGWPHSMQAEACLRGIFELLGRLRRPAAALHWIAALRKANLPGPSTRILVNCLADVARNAVDHGVCLAAADALRVVVAQRLPEADPADAERFVAAVVRLAPHDRLLDRDAQRYLALRPRKTAPPKPPAPRSNRQPTLLRTIRLPPQVEWQSIVSAGDIFYVAGFANRQLRVLRGAWDGTLQMAVGGTQPYAVLGSKAILLFPPDEHPQDAGWLRLHVCAGSPPQGPVFAAHDRLGGSLEIGSAGAGENVLGMVRSTGGRSTILHLQGDDLVLSTYLWSAIQTSRPIDPPPNLTRPWRPSDVPVPMCQREGVLYFALDDVLYSLDDGRLDTIALPDVARRLVASPPRTQSTLAVSFPDGAGLLDPHPGHAVQRFASGLQSPVIGRTRGGAWIVAAAEGCSAYRDDHRSVALLAALPGGSETPLAVLPVEHPNQFALLTNDAALRIYGLP